MPTDWAASDYVANTLSVALLLLGLVVRARRNVRL